MEKPTEIYRFGHYINTVPDNKESLRKWLIDNCPYHKSEGGLPPTASLAECLKIARERGFHFTTTVTESISGKSVERLVKILAYAKIEQVAQELSRFTVKGRNIICPCPSCNTEGSLLVLPKFQTYRCFSCGTSGNVVSFVMEALKMDYETALDFLETKYVK